LPAFLGATTQVWMILSEDCDFEKIRGIAAQNGFRLAVVFEKKKWGERFWVATVGEN